MKYIIAKIKSNKDTLSTIFNIGTDSKINFLDSEVYDTIEEAKYKLAEYQTELDALGDKAWEKLTSKEKENYEKSITEDGYVYLLDKYIIVPIYDIFTLTTVPKHLRKE